MNRRNLLRYAAAATCGAAMFAAQAQGAAYPTKAIRIVVSSAPGALTDQAARMYGERMSTFLGQPVVIENVAGAGSLLASRQVVRAPADGYTLLAAANTVVTVPHVNPKAGYSLKDFTAVGELARSPSLLVVGGSSRFRTLPELVAEAKKKPRSVTYASGGIGTTSHLPAELFARQAGIELVHVPYKAIALAVPDVVATRSDFGMGTATGFGELMKKGNLRALAITAEKRSPRFPDVPTFKELGYPDVSFEIWIGLLAPAGTPKAVVDRLGAALESARKDPKLVSYLEGAGQEISDVRTPAQFDAVLRGDDARLGKLVKEANIVAD